MKYIKKENIDMELWDEMDNSSHEDLKETILELMTEDQKIRLLGLFAIIVKD